MKSFFTSYYAKKGRDPLAVSISAKAPSYFSGRWYQKLAPTWDILNAYKHGEIDEDEYTLEYLHLLDRVKQLDPHQCVNDLADGSILLCYEADDGSFCHRHIAAEWIQRHTGVIVREWRPVNPQEVLINYLVVF